MQMQQNFNNYYSRIDEKIIKKVVKLGGFTEALIRKYLKDNINNHCTTAYYLLCLDQ